MKLDGFIESGTDTLQLVPNARVTEQVIALCSASVWVWHGV